MQLLVLGMHRSGTSMVTRLINMMGAYFATEGAALEFNDDNPKGYWERKDVLRLNQEILHAYRCNWFDLRQWNADKKPPMNSSLNYKIKSLTLDLDAHRPWVLKDPRLCLTLPCWLPHLEVPVAIIASRDPLEIAISLHRRNQFPLEFGLALWEYHAVETLNATRNLPKIFVQHADIINDSVVATTTLYHDLVAEEVQGLRLPSTREIHAFVEPSLHRARSGQVKAVPLSPFQATLYAALRGEQAMYHALQPSAESIGIMHRLAGAVSFVPNANQPAP